jgi:hypothetical protein
MTERNDTETRSYREEQGKSPDADARERMADVPLAPSSAGVVGAPPRQEDSTVDADRAAAERATTRPDDAERGEVF